MESSPTISEGAAQIRFPENVSKDDVFYNPVQVFNRDLTCLVIRTFKQQSSGNFNIFEAFAASGLRTIRYCLEIPGIKAAIANDIDINAVKVIEMNIKSNKVSKIVKSSHGDAIQVMASHRRQFQAIDLDPYGTVAPFLDSAVQAVSNGGLLCISSTDGRTLCGTQLDASYALYNTMPLNADFAHEFGLRVLLTSVGQCASRYGRFIKPLLSISANFYFRVYVAVYDTFVSDFPMSMCFYSPSSASFWLQPLGSLYTKEIPVFTQKHTRDPLTNERLKIAGPIYSGPLHDKQFLSKLLDVLPSMVYLTTDSRIKAVIKTAYKELDTPLYYDLHTMTSIVKSSCPPRALIATQLRKHGFSISLTHIKAGMYKTDAPPQLLWDIIRCWYFNEGKSLPEKDSAAKSILSADPMFKVNLDIDEDIVSQIKKEKKELKFYENPSSHFGPKAPPKSRNSKVIL